MQLNITGFSEAEVMTLLLKGLEAQREVLLATITRIEAQITGNTPSKRGRPKLEAALPAPGKRKRAPMSPEARQRIVEAQKKRWAKVRREAKALAKGATPAKREKKVQNTPIPAPEAAREAAVQ